MGIKKWKKIDQITPVYAILAVYNIRDTQNKFNHLEGSIMREEWWIFREFMKNFHWLISGRGRTLPTLNYETNQIFEINIWKNLERNRIPRTGGDGHERIQDTWRGIKMLIRRALGEF